MKKSGLADSPFFTPPPQNVEATPPLASPPPQGDNSKVAPQSIDEDQTNSPAENKNPAGKENRFVNKKTSKHVYVSTCLLYLPPLFSSIKTSQFGDAL